MIVFGSSRKTDQEEPIGMYGNGLKSGSMRLGKDMILFTKKDGVLTCLMISRTFYAAENVTQVGVGSIPRLYIDICIYHSGKHACIVPLGYVSCGNVSVEL